MPTTAALRKTREGGGRLRGSKSCHELILSFSYHKPPPAPRSSRRRRVPQFVMCFSKQDFPIYAEESFLEFCCRSSPLQAIQQQQQQQVPPERVEQDNKGVLTLIIPTELGPNSSREVKVSRAVLR